MVAREDKKELILDNAVGIFAENGYYKATTALIAKAAGVTQPYVFHFFKNKEELFIAVIDRASKRIYEAFSGVDAPADQLMDTMGHEFMKMMKTHKDEIILVMQSHAISETVIRDHVKEKFRLVHELVTEKLKMAGYPNPEAGATQFLGIGFLVTVAQVLELPQLLCFE
ncbi:TetR/AcrR family transcriptional regulator [Lederbergia wuyishanensis]|uniref:AcrR family transcriptional regulator n=1 Tax=Lederbergia wuyishanensis TaxID=1347903 RepID=A0ABU0D349_9BACI|nr:TetR/AcrR family transcriptional regulator [Lederbergia wuyishanensis]MCJ8007050.1 TetR/AcrR family transcriptional regulator [Lederbergia wuyishanensis]MDQ0342806.1 AcrR family transcriptional regulator [Lederbergia wuyishanensis]